ncbi:hypothetical protein ROZALSC1DRAFT_22135 [Rozella allomycis CSF55]|uniref:Uncharacterized protein n=1 Tax=Rozella allomycis (strain CSF55) TaxID=988480 RepID=A0A4P9YJ72_ROZAC|nr:hypothetical protein ROZALSC1DRAFT_22135 [Rozella allomycis CSF55]
MLCAHSLKLEGLVGLDNILPYYEPSSEKFWIFVDGIMAVKSLSAQSIGMGLFKHHKNMPSELFLGIIAKNDLANLANHIFKMEEYRKLIFGPWVPSPFVDKMFKYDSVNVLNTFIKHFGVKQFVLIPGIYPMDICLARGSYKTAKLLVKVLLENGFKSRLDHFFKKIVLSPIRSKPEYLSTALDLYHQFDMSFPEILNCFYNRKQSGIILLKYYPKNLNEMIIHLCQNERPFDVALIFKELEDLITEEQYYILLSCSVKFVASFLHVHPSSTEILNQVKQLV